MATKGTIKQRKTIAILTVAEITSKAISLLCQQIGSANTARFLHQFSMGAGDYTAERDLGDPTVNDLVQQIKQRRSEAARS